MSEPRMIRLVAARETRQRLKAKSFPIFTGLLCLLIIGGGVLNRALSVSSSPPKYRVAVLGTAPDGFDAVLQHAAQSTDVTIRASTVATRAAGEQQLKDGKLDAVVDVDATQLITKKKPPDKLAASVNAAWQAARGREAAVTAGLDPTQVQAIVAPAALTEQRLDTNDSSSDRLGILVGMASAVLLFISITSFGGYVLMGVVEEKTTGVVEVLLSKVRAHQLLAGKVLGIGVVAMIQFTAAIAAGLISLKISGTTVPSAIWVGLPATLLWFVGGFLLYSTLFALAGSFVSRQEDAQGAAAPISMVFTAAYITVFTLGYVPDSLASRILSVIPPFAPLLMPLRMVTGSASILEIGVAAVLLVAAIYGMLRLAGAVYSRTLLHRGSRLRWKEVLHITKTG
jgi:ABC-2 type transport system permease protein